MRLPAVAAAVAALLLTACGDGGGGVLERSAPSTSTEPTTTTLAPSTSTTSATGRTTTTSRATATTRPGSAPTTTAATSSGALTPAVPGTYRYTTSGRTTFAGNTLPFPGVTTLVVDPPQGTTQRQTRNLRDATGNGLATELVLDYRPAGVFLVSLKLTVGFAGMTDVRDLRPPSPVLLLATGARPGAHAEADLGAGTSSAKLVTDVVGSERVTVAGQAVDTVVLRTTVTLAPGDVTGRQQLTVNLDRGTRLWVRERSVVDASAAGGLFTLHGDYTATIQRLSP